MVGKIPREIPLLFYKLNMYNKMYNFIRHIDVKHEIV